MRCTTITTIIPSGCSLPAAVPTLRGWSLQRVSIPYHKMSCTSYWAVKQKSKMSCLSSAGSPWRLGRCTYRGKSWDQGGMWVGTARNHKEVLNKYPTKERNHSLAQPQKTDFNPTRGNDFQWSSPTTEWVALWTREPFATEYIQIYLRSPLQILQG